MSYSDAQRLAFGTVAELYDRHRPGYPPEAIDRLVRAAGLVAGDEVLEVGAGTGKLTVPLARRGLRVLAIERLTAEEYLATLLTHQDHILLAPAVRDRLLAAVTAVIEGVGGRLELPLLCRLGLAVAR